MVKLFKNEPSNASRSLQIYLILIGAAACRATMTYSMLSEKIYGQPDQRHTLGQKLEPLMRWCKANEIPALTALVVTDATGVPSTGLTTVDKEFPAEQQKVFAFDWYSIFPPSLDELRNL